MDACARVASQDFMAVAKKKVDNKCHYILFKLFIHRYKYEILKNFLSLADLKLKMTKLSIKCCHTLNAIFNKINCNTSCIKLIWNCNFANRFSKFLEKSH